MSSNFIIWQHLLNLYLWCPTIYYPIHVYIFSLCPHFFAFFFWLTSFTYAKEVFNDPILDVFFSNLFNLSISYMGINVLLNLTISNFQKLHLNWKMKNYKHYKHLYMKGRLVGKDAVDQWILNKILFMYNILMHGLIHHYTMIVKCW
jgi:hypothetical protein